jgi:hypothetical protein
MIKNKLNISQRKINTVIPVDTTEISIRQLDWRRIYREVKSIPRKNSFFLTAAGVFFGVGGSAILSLIPLYQAAQNVDPWVKPTYYIIGIAALIVGLIIVYFSKEEDKMIKSSCLAVQQDMKEINSIFFPNDNLDVD